MRILIILLLLTSCQKEITSPCGTVTGKGSLLNIHGTYLEIDSVRVEVNLPTYTKYEIGDTYRQ